MQNKTKKNRKNCKDCKGIFCQHENYGKDVAKFPFSLSSAQQSISFLENLLKENEHSPEEILRISSKSELFQLGMSPLCVVAAMGHMDGMCKFIEAGSDVNEKTANDGNTPLMLATQNRHMEMVDLLLKYAAKVSEANSDGNNAFMIAVRTGDAKLVNLIWAYRGNLDVNHRNVQGCTVLHIAADKIWESCVQFLLKNGAEINKTNLAGWTPLMLACMKGDMKTIQRLVDSGADILKEDFTGYTAVCWALDNEKVDITEYLLGKMRDTERNEFVKNRIERLKNPLDETDTETFYEEILIPTFEVLSKMAEFRTILHKHKLIQELPVAMQKHLKNTTLILGISVTCINLLFDPHSDNHIDERFVQQYTRSRLPDLCLKAMKMHLDSTKVLNDTILSFFIPYLCMIETPEGKEWLEKNSIRVVTYTGLRRRFDLYKHPDERIKGKIIMAWKRFWDHFEIMLQRQRDQKMCELLEEEERERSRKSKKREKRKLKKQRNQQYKVAKEQTNKLETETVEENPTADAVGDVQVEPLLERRDDTILASENVLKLDRVMENFTPDNRSFTDVVSGMNDEINYEVITSFDRTENAWVTVQGKKMQDRSSKSEKNSEDAWKMKSIKRNSITPQKKEDVKNWADVAKGKTIHENPTRKESKRKSVEKQYEEEFPSLPNSRRSSDIGIANTSFNEEKPSPPENWDDSDGQSSSGFRECTYAELLQGQKQHIPLECEDNVNGVVSLKAIADNVLFSPFAEKHQPNDVSPNSSEKINGRAERQTTNRTVAPVSEAYSSNSSDGDSLENERVLDEMSPRSDWSDILLEENMKISEAMNTAATEKSSAHDTATEHEHSMEFLTEVLKAPNTYGKASQFLPIDQSNPNYENLLQAMNNLPKDCPYSTIYPVASKTVANLESYLLPELKQNKKHDRDLKIVSNTAFPENQSTSENRHFISHQNEYGEELKPTQNFEGSSSHAIKVQHEAKDRATSCSPGEQTVTTSRNVTASLFDGRHYNIAFSETTQNIPIELSENVAVVKPIGYTNEINTRNINSDSAMFDFYNPNGLTSLNNTTTAQRNETCSLGESILQNAAKIDTTPDEVWFPSSLDGIPVVSTDANDKRESDNGFFFPSFHDITKPNDADFRNACNQMELLKLLQLQKYFNFLCQGNTSAMMSDYYNDFWYYASTTGLTKEALELISGKADQQINNFYRNLLSYNTGVNVNPGGNETRCKTRDNTFHGNDNHKETTFLRMEKQQEVDSVLFPQARSDAMNVFTQDQMSGVDGTRISQRTDLEESRSRLQYANRVNPNSSSMTSLEMANINIDMAAETNQIRSSVPSNSSPIISNERANIKWNIRSKRWRNKLADILKLPPEFRKNIGNIIIPWKCRDTFKVPYSDKNVQLGFLMDGSEVAVETIDLETEKISLEFLHSLTSNAMSHYFLVKYRSYALDSSTCYLAMDLHEYTLDEYMHLIQLNYDADALSVNKLAWQVLKGLSSLHENCGIAHGNIMPSNILIDLEGKIRLSEYGFTRKVMNTNQLIVSDCPLAADRRCWVPTEVMTETAPYSMKSDIQVAGMLLYYILTGGRHPFGNSSSLEIQCGIHHNWPNMMYFLEEANHLITEMIKMPPEDRPTVADLMRHPYFWADEKRLRFVLIVGSDVLRDLKLGVPTSGGTGNTMIDIMNSVGCDTSFSEWINVIDPLIMKEMRSFRQYKNTLVELVLFIYNCCLHFDKLSQIARELIDEPCRYFLTKFPTLFMCVYRAIKSSVRQEKTCYKPFF